jgi:hypothetical protein
MEVKKTIDYTNPALARAKEPTGSLLRMVRYKHDHALVLAVGRLSSDERRLI